MGITLFEGELYNDYKAIESMEHYDMNAINQKYEAGQARIVTEQGAFKLPLLETIFKQENYKLRPDFQRRLTWDNRAKSKLIESFIINVPVPPVFIYEYDFDKYEVMDGLQRISSIIDFYKNNFALIGLDEWPELNGLYYNELPEKIREGIDRRQLPSITMLKESAKSILQAQNFKKMVFERLNTGGVKLEPQEIRNALYDGKFNKLCIELSANDSFRKTWDIKISTTNQEELGAELFENTEEVLQFEKNKLYMRMYDVEIVLRYFAMRHLTDFTGQLSLFLDNVLKSGNLYSDDLLDKLRNQFNSTINKADKIFGDKVFCQWKKNKWTYPQRFIYDPMMIALTALNLEKEDFDIAANQELLKQFYLKHEDSDLFNGRKQLKADIEKRVQHFFDFISGLDG